MKTVLIRSRHKKRIILLIVGLLLVVWYFFPRGTFEDMPLFGKQLPSDGLTYAKRQFFLDNKPFRILSGAMHYFRVPQEYWEDRMLKMKACGLNTLETYVSWNLHEPIPGHFDYSGRLNLRKYLETAHKLGLYVILRPGPYICSEWDFGGMPSWLLSDSKMVVRSNYEAYQEAIANYLTDLLSQVSDLQFTLGGPIIAVQVENEFGSYSNEVDHLMFIKGLLRMRGIKELLMTSDGAEGIVYAPFHKDALPTANFKDFAIGRTIFEMIRQANADFPLMVMEFWTGWFDHWGEEHNTRGVQDYAEALTQILEAGASVNLYMFHGGTNFGFMAGANEFQLYKPDVTSYDYDSPLSEAGDITVKYLKTRELLLNLVYKPLGIMELPEVPPNIPKVAYADLRMKEMMNWTELTSHITKRQHSETVLPMEMYKFDGGVGQSYGYIVYRKQIGSGDKLELPLKIHDRAQVLLNMQSVGMLDFKSTSSLLSFKAEKPSNLLDIVVENLGRVNFINTNAPDTNLLNKQRKGLSGDVKIDGKFVTDWTALALDFEEEFIQRVSRASRWMAYTPQKNTPALYRAYLNIEHMPKDTFINMKDWSKGIVIVNGINLGRYWEIGPQKTLYLPAPFLKKGINEFLIFEEHSSGEYLYFKTEPHLG